MQILDMSSLESITARENGERLIKGTFDGFYVEQTLPSVSNPGFWAFNSSVAGFIFIPLEDDYKFAEID